MKKIFTLLAFALLLVTACNQDRLEIPKKGVVSEESFYKTDADAESALAAAYYHSCRAMCAAGNGNGSLYAPLLSCFSIPSDDFWGGGANFGDTDYLSKPNEWRADSQNSVFNTCYKQAYSAIFYANCVITKFDASDSAVKAKCIDEARFLRAMFHMYLAIGWGNPPIVTEILSGDARPGNSEPGECLAFCESEFKDILPRLSKRNGPNDKAGVYRANQGICRALLAKTQMWMGKYAEAQANLKAIMESGDYALVPGEQWHDLFHLGGDGSSEKMMEYNCLEFTHGGNWNTGAYKLFTQQFRRMNHWRNSNCYIPTGTYNQTGYGAGNPSAKFAEALIANDGMDSYRRKGTVLTFDEVILDCKYNSDVDCPTDEAKMADDRRGIHNAAGLFGHEGYFSNKWNMRAEETMRDNWNEANFHIMRYAEVLLMYAECCVQTGTDKDKGLAALNEVQRRAGSKTISSELTLKAVQNEKWFEFWYEGLRWADCVRWGIAAQEFSNASKKPGRKASELPSFVDSHFTDVVDGDGTFIAAKDPTHHKGYVIWRDYEFGNPDFDPNKDVLFPYPFSEINVNQNIKQNPGW